jgi:hypothetical protein
MNERCSVGIQSALFLRTEDGTSELAPLNCAEHFVACYLR